MKTQGGSSETVSAAAVAGATRGTRAKLFRSGVSFGSAIAAATILNALFQITLAHVSTPGNYSLLVTLFAAILVLGVPALAVQTAAAREVAARLADADEAGAGAVVRSIGRQVFRAFVVGSALAVLIIVALRPLVKLHHVWPLAWTAVAVGCSFELAVVYGALQGMQRIGTLGIAQLAHVVVKIVLGFALAAVGAGVAGVMFALAVAAGVTLAGAAVPLRGLLAAGRGRKDTRPVFTRYSSAVAGALGIFSVLTTGDLLVARAAFTPKTAGAYAAASVVARALLIVPNTVTTVLFPRVSTLGDRVRERRHLLAALGATGALAGFGALLLSAFPHALLRIAFGADYVSASPWLWQLAVAMTLYALAYIYLFHFLAVGRIGYVFVAAPILVVQAPFYVLMHARPVQLIALQIGAALALVVSSELFDRGTTLEQQGAVT